MVDPSVAIFGPLDTYLGPYMEYVLVALAVLTLLTRILQHNSIKRQVQSGAEDLDRSLLHFLTMGVFVLAALYYTTLHQHSGVVISTLVVGTFIADFFEFEARNVEAREGHDIEKPKGATVVALTALLYAAYLSLFFLIEPYWNMVV